MAENITNQQVLDALRSLGYGNLALDVQVDMGGAQNSAFKKRLFDAHSINQDQFDQAKQLARDVVGGRATLPPLPEHFLPKLPPPASTARRAARPTPQPGPTPPAGGGGAGGVTRGVTAAPTDITRIIQDALATKTDVSINDVDEIINRVYGFSAFALEIPEVRKVMDQAAAEDWDEARIKGAIIGTGWWKRTSDAERGWLALEKQDPATAARRRSEQMGNLKAQSRGFVVDETRLNQIAELSLRHGWSSAQTSQALAAEFKFDPTGQKSTFSRQLKQMASDYVIPMSNDTIEKWGMQLIAGTASEEDFEAFLSDQASSMFPALEASLARGMSVRDFLNPYVEVAARNLEVAPDSIDLSDPKWIRAVNQVDPKTGERTVMSLSDWDSTLKLDPTYGWDKTKQAREQASGLASSILQTFGAL